MHQLADPARAARLLGIGLDALLTGRDAAPPTLRDGDQTWRLWDGRDAYRPLDGVAVVPAALLGA